MSEIIAFARYFPDWHEEAGKPTFFVEKIWKSLPSGAKPVGGESMSEVMNDQALSLAEPKYHTIRSGTQFKAGDIFTPKVWLGAAYQSQQVVFAPDIKVKQTWSFNCDESGLISINGSGIDEQTKLVLAKNDGLSIEEFNNWLVLPCLKNKRPFTGQIICWSADLNY